MRDDFSQCMVTNSRMAARAITRRYDSYLRPHGVTATQLSLLGALRAMPGTPVSRIAEDRGFERTTLTRNLDRLEEIGLVTSRRAARGNARIVEITTRGEQAIAVLLPLWRQAQAELRSELGGDRFDTTIGALRRLASTQQEISA